VHLYTTVGFVNPYIQRKVSLLVPSLTLGEDMRSMPPRCAEEVVAHLAAAM